MKFLNIVSLLLITAAVACTVQKKAPGIEASASFKAVIGPTTSETASVVSRLIFYNRSSSMVFGDGSGNPINAIDKSKIALLPGETSSSVNYTNYSKGINGLLVDINGTTGNISTSDFLFETWDGLSASGFTPLSSVFLVREFQAQGLGGSKRVKLEFPDGSIKNTWLKVTVKATAATNLSVNDTFYFGNALGDVYAGNIGTPVTVRSNVTDTAMVRQYQSPSANSVAIDSIYDLNKDGRVNATDIALVRQNQSPAIIKMFTAISTFFNPAEPPVNSTACTTHAGQPYPWEGTGACTGNYQVSIPIGSTGQMLIQNSNASSGNFGFGETGFRLSVDKRLYKVSSQIIKLENGDGSIIGFHPEGAGWLCDYPQLSESALQTSGANFIEKLPDGTKITYAPISSINGAYGVTSIEKRNGSSLSIVRNSKGHITSITNDFGIGTQIHYSSSHHADIITDADGNEYSLNYSSDQLSQLNYPTMPAIWWEIKYAVGSNRVVTVKAPENAYTQISYDTDGKLNEVVSPDKKKTSISYFNGYVQISGFMSNIFESFDQSGALAKSISENLSTLYTRDSFKRPLTVTDHLGRVTSYTYDNRRLKSVTMPNLMNTIIGYDLSGNVTSTKTTGPAKSILVEYVYDTQNRLLSVTGPGNYLKSIAYDAKGNVKTVKINKKQVALDYGAGNLLKSYSENGVATNYGYDAHGHVASVSNPGGQVQFQNKTSGLPILITSDEIIETRSYDPLGRPTEISKISPSSGKSAYTTSYQYGLNQLLQTDNLGNGVLKKYDPSGAYSEHETATGQMGNPYNSGYSVSHPTYTEQE